MARALALLFVLPVAGPGVIAETRGDVRLLLGLKYLDNNEWGSLSNQVQWGLQLARQPVSVEAELHGLAQIVAGPELRALSHERIARA